MEIEDFLPIYLSTDKYTFKNEWTTKQKREGKNYPPRTWENFRTKFRSLETTYQQELDSSKQASIGTHSHVNILSEGKIVSTGYVNKLDPEPNKIIRIHNIEYPSHLVCSVEIEEVFLKVPPPYPAEPGAQELSFTRETIYPIDIKDLQSIESHGAFDNLQPFSSKPFINHLHLSINISNKCNNSHAE